MDATKPRGGRKRRLAGDGQGNPRAARFQAGHPSGHSRTGDGGIDDPAERHGARAPPDGLQDGHCRARHKLQVRLRIEMEAWPPVGG